MAILRVNSSGQVKGGQDAKKAVQQLFPLHQTRAVLRGKSQT